MSHEMLVVLRFSILALCAAAAWMMWMMARIAKHTAAAVFLGLAFLYPLGKVFQFWVLGPRFVRWYMSDVGFVPFTALAIGLFLMSKNWGIQPAFRRSLGTALRLGILVELMQLAISAAAKKHVEFSAAGDWWDMACYITAYVLCRFLFSLYFTQPVFAKVEARVQARRPQRDRHSKRRR